jgi:hypothetical protein
MTSLQEIHNAERLVNAGGSSGVSNWSNTGITIQAIDDAVFGAPVTVRYAGTGSTAFSGFDYAMTPMGITVGATSDQTKSPDQVRYEKRKALLIDVIKSMRQEAPNWSGLATRIDPLSAGSAEAFLRCLPGNAVLPRVAPDGEGDVMFVWDGQNQPACVVTVEQRALHLACELGTPQEQHIGEQRFLGVCIPPDILNHIPSK